MTTQTVTATARGWEVIVRCGCGRNDPYQTLVPVSENPYLVAERVERRHLREWHMESAERREAEARKAMQG